VIELRALPNDGNLAERVHELLRPGVLLPVNLNAMTMKDIHYIFRNADEYILLCLGVDPDLPGGKVALRELYERSRRVRHAAKMLLIWRRVPLAKPVADKYRKAIADNYPAMSEAGFMLAKIGKPELADLYRVPSTR
jgi:hypothetical protein